MDDAPVALLLTDLVDSSALAARLGDEAMAQLSAQHDRVARDLLRLWRGHEIDKTDGFLLLFALATDAMGYAVDYHRALAALPVPMKARAGLHVGQVTIRAAPDDDVALGAKPFEVDGISKPLAARVMSAALGGQTLLTQTAVEALGTTPFRVVNHGHWAVKGLPEPLELFEAGHPQDGIAPFEPPPDSTKVWRVVRDVRDERLWLPARAIRHTLPAERDAFVGRRSSLQALAARFDEGARLVSLLGIGGGGKTRLATRFGWSWLGAFPGGVWFCDLAPARTVEGLASAVALGLELPLGQEDPVVQIGQALAGRGRCLLILDNFEHLARWAEPTLGRWLDRAPEAGFLVTTREVLGISGEQTLALAPLQADDAEALFHKRAAAAKRDFQPNSEDRAAIATLVHLLDGLPLAIELAAARVRTLAPRALLARMSERFKLLASGSGRLDRQATLRATFDWSWGLLPTAEKAALAQLSVFEGGFTLEAAEAVIDLGMLDDPPWTLDVVNALVDKSFVRPPSHDRGQDRFDLLGSVQAYAAEHLASDGRYIGSGEAARTAAETRHGAWFSALGSAAAITDRGIELDNLTVACRRAVQRGDCAQAAGALDAAWAALNLRGPFKAGVDLATLVLAMPGLAGREAAHAHAVSGMALEAAGQRQAAVERYAAATALAEAAGDRACRATVAIRTASLAARAGQADEARQGLQLALALAQDEGELALQVLRELGDRVREAMTLVNLGMLRFFSGDVSDAADVLERGLAAARELGHRRLECIALANLGLVLDGVGRSAEAVERYDTALALARQLGDRRSEGQFLGHRAVAQARQGQAAEAREALATAAILLLTAGDPVSRGLLATQRSEVEWLAGDATATRAALAEAEALAAGAAAGPDSELGKAIARLRERLAA